MFSQTEIFLLMLAGFVFYSQGSALSDRDDFVLSLFLIAVILAFLLVFVTQSVNIFKKKVLKNIIKDKVKIKTDSLTGEQAQDAGLLTEIHTQAPPTVLPAALTIEGVTTTNTTANPDGT